MNINMSFSILANNRWLRLGLIGVLAVIALVVTLAFVLVDSRKVADVAAAAVEKTTGRRLTLNGPVSLKLFPHLAVVAEDVALSNAPWAAEPEMAKADRVAFSLDWLPMLQEQISIPFCWADVNFPAKTFTCIVLLSCNLLLVVLCDVNVPD